MPRGSKPLPPGQAVAPRNQVHKWQLAEGEGWQHGKKPPPPANLTDAGKKAWRVWIGSWFACFWTPDDLPGLELTVTQYDRVLQGTLDVAKVVPLLDRYGITPKGRQDLRWARQSDVKKPAAKSTAVPDEVDQRRQARRSKLA